MSAQYEVMCLFSSCHYVEYKIMHFLIFVILIYLLTAIGLPPSGSSILHIYTQTIHRTTQNKQYRATQKFLKSAGCAPFVQFIPWHLPYN